MKKGILVILLVLVSAIYADVMFYDNFNRTNGDVGNDWQFNTPPHLTNSSIINGVYNIDLTSTGNTFHNFTSQTTGKVYVEYEWKLITNDWTACIYPVSELIFIRVDWLGNITYDDNSSFTSPTTITQINFDQWYDVKICYDLDNDTFSFWIDNIQYVTNASANSISSINSFYFLNINAPNFIQQIDEFIVYNDETPDIPQNLTATENVDDITLNWDAVPNPLLVNYKIFRDTSSNPTTEVAEVGPDITTYIDVVRALPNTDYYYRIKAVGINELESDYSNEVGVVQLKPDISVDPTEIEIQLNTSSNTQTEYFDINNSGNGQLKYFVQGDDTLGDFGSCLDFDGVNDRNVNAVITSNAIAPDDNLEIPVTVKVDYNPPLAVQNVVFTSSTPDEIQIDWDSNAISDSVYYYNVYRRSNDEPTYSLIGNSSTTTYIDYAFTGLDTTYFWYKVAGMDWVDNEGTHSFPCRANLNRFKAPQNLQITMENNNRNVKLVWDSVTETISGLPGTPTCYVVYYNQIDAETDENFYFLATSSDTTYTHQNVGLFIETDHMFYTVTAYGGSMRALNYFNDNDITFRFGELEKMISDFSKNKANIQHKKTIKNRNKK
ncbi:MAG: fibronectin type III domain-containing protein [Candidatus Cloacimonetes bacterium]|nr:fibronectin type III domain-containing protein [Candidatus Cloacimonadota bacterium]